MSAGGNARKADTPWRGRPIHGSRGTGQTNQKRQAEARKQLDRCQLDLGREWTAEAVREWHQQSRLAVLRRYGVTP